ncbi:flagellar hook-basal body complex protein [Acidaminobacter sp.]|uniref:flagellar hook-basal body complex protein n=1 Tax=Acidaminobacter sp. TaxID=1872102 RepID=UPI001380D0E1|nr:flagellar hook-basal body complex protein [Acidaminobacter sp.]MDK9710579.1 flagellar hook-basal body complex protein [Acidaminobacter sp.]MZQ96810.1 flagellar hook-basal body complex protein [Acidaminobacter sp.]
MLRSMYSGVSGMRSYQTKMDVIGNNIANVGTTAFKSGTAQFQDLLSEMINSGQSPIQGGLGGINPQQIGLGVSVGKISTNMTNGSLQPTGRELDFALEGNGFFAVCESESIQALDELRFTRDGSFLRDSTGNLIMGSGFRLMGISNVTLDDSGATLAVGADINMEEVEAEDLKPIVIPDSINIEGEIRSLVSFTIDGSGKVMVRYSDGVNRELGQVPVIRFANAGGLEKQGGNTYGQSQNSGNASFGNSGQNGFGIIRKGYLEMSNVDLANEFTEMIITSRSYQANSRTITTSDEMLQELLNLKR